jgi:hypothetical protein
MAAADRSDQDSVNEDKAERMKRANALYDRYAKHLEPEHEGEYVAIFPNGDLVIGSEVLDVAEEALAKFGKGATVFKIGERAVWHVR